MQQSSSLPERNSLIDGTPPVLNTIEQLQHKLWLESRLNHLQSRLNDCLLSSANTIPKSIVTEAEIFELVIKELNSALNEGYKDLTQYVVGIAQCQPQKTVGNICYVSNFSYPATAIAEIQPDAEKKLLLRLNAAIKLEDLQQMERLEPPQAWRLIDDFSSVMAWLIIATNPNSHRETIDLLPNQMRSHLITRTIDYCNTALAQLRQLQSWQKHCQQLTKFNQELERTNQLKNKFLANTSHEIRTPLSSIIGFTHLLLAQGYEPEKQRHQEYLKIIQSSGKHLLGLINDILDLSKIEADQLEVQWEIVDVPILCRNVLALMKEKVANKGLKLRLEIDDKVETLLVDPLRLKQMLLNLLFNAVKFTNSGSVGLKVTTKDLYLRFTIWDTGIGISPENQTLLFRPYSQIINSLSESNEGTGLGLVVTQQLAEIHGGYLELESEVNRGSNFTLVLPLQPMGKILESIEIKANQDLEFSKEASNYPASLSGAVISGNFSPEILLVENDIANAELITIYLGRLGYHVTCVNDAQEMWINMSKLKPAVILMDVKLPSGNGLELVQQLRNSPQYQQIPIIVQTAMAMKGDRETCLAAGVNDYISKPIDLQLLASVVAKYCQLGNFKKSQSLDNS